jgi:hypothetical protein
MATRVVTGKVRLSFPHLFEPYNISGDEQEPKYSVMLLIPKSDSKTVKALRAAEREAAEAGKANKFSGKEVNAPSIIKDGDEDGSAEDYPERAGMYYMTVSSNRKYKPGVVDKDLNEVIDQSEVYSGVYGKVSVTAFPYLYGNNKRGVSFGLNNVQVVGGGESLGGGKRAVEEFEAVTEDEDAGADLL